MFHWKQHFFFASIIEGIQLKVEWCSSGSVSRDRDEEEEEEGEDDKVDSAIPADDEEYFGSDLCDNGNNILTANSSLKTPLSPKNNLSTGCTIFKKKKAFTFHLGHRHASNILKVGFSFDCLKFYRVPVILVELQNPSNVQCSDGRILSRQQLHKHGGEIWSRKLLLFGINDKLNNASGEKDGRFSLSPLRVFDLTNHCDNIFDHDCNLKLLPNFGLFYFDINQPVLTFKLYFGQTMKKSELSTQSCVANECKDINESKSDLRVMALHNSYLNGMFLVIVRWTNDESSCRKCRVFLFYNLSRSKYEMKEIDIDPLFPEEFAGIADAVTISALEMTRTPLSIVSATVMMFSSTNYVIRFSQGIMTHCIALDESFHIQQNITVRGHADFMWDGVLKTALHVKDKCFLLDWNNEKLSMLQDEHVQCIAGCANDDLSSRMLLSSAHENRDSASKLEISLVNVCEIGCHIKEDEHSPSPFFSSQSKSKERDEDLPGEELKLDKASENVLAGLMNQEKKCQLDLLALEQSLRCKEAFIHQTVNHFSQLKAEAKWKAKHVDLPPLMPLTDGNHSISATFDIDKDAPRHWKVGKLWKKTINTFLVCGVEMVKMCHTDQLCDIYLLLVPVNPCRKTVTSKSAIQHRCSVNPLTPSSSSSSLSSHSSEHTYLSPPCKKARRDPSILHENTKVTVTAYLDTRDFWGCQDIMVQTYLAYSVLQETEDGGKAAVKCSKHLDCGMASISQEEKLDDLYSLNSKLKNWKMGDISSSPEDLLALDCVQTNLDLKVCSVLSPVTSLLTHVKSHPCMVKDTPSVNQHTYTADHSRLQLCRVEWIKRVDKTCAIIRIFACTQDALLLFIEFLHSISPADMTFHLYQNSSLETQKMKSMDQMASLLSDSIEQSVCKRNRSLESISAPPKIEVDISDGVEIITDDNDISLSPKFISSVQSQRVDRNLKPALEAENTKTTGSTIPIVKPKSGESVEKTSRSAVKDDFLLFDFGDEFEEEVKVKRGAGVKKSSKGKLGMRKK